MAKRDTREISAVRAVSVLIVQLYISTDELLLADGNKRLRFDMKWPALCRLLRKFPPSFIFPGQYTSMCKRELYSSVCHGRKEILMFLLILQIFSFAGKKLLVYILCDLFIQSLYLAGFICCSNSKRVPFDYLLLIKERNKQIRYEYWSWNRTIICILNRQGCIVVLSLLITELLPYWQFS